MLLYCRKCEISSIIMADFNSVFRIQSNIYDGAFFVEIVNGLVNKDIRSMSFVVLVSLLLTWLLTTSTDSSIADL